MAQTYTLFKVKLFLGRIKEEQERAKSYTDKIKDNPKDYKEGTIIYYGAKIDLCEDLLRIAEGIFGSDVKEV